MVMSKSDAGRLGGLKISAIYRDRYAKDPKVCPCCKEHIIYEKRYNKFCSSSCSATYNNIARGKYSVPCLNCNKKTVNIKGRKYCSHKCQREFEKKARYDVFLSGVNVKYDVKTIRGLLIESYGHCCSTCKGTEWLGNSIPIEVHHVDGDAGNNRFNNLVLVCPNCHTLTDNYKNKNKNGTREYRRKYYQPV